MKITVRAYRRSDPDIVGLCLMPEFDFSTELHRVLCSFVRGEPYRKTYEYRFYKETVFPTVIQRKVILDPAEDADVISWLKMIRPMERNNFLKNLFRSSLAGFPAQNYFRNEEDFQYLMRHLPEQENEPRISGKDTESSEKDIKKNVLSEDTIGKQHDLEKIPSKESAAKEKKSGHQKDGSGEPVLEKADQNDKRADPVIEEEEPSAVDGSSADIDDFDDLEQMMEQFY